MLKNNSRGLSLVEVLVSTAIIAVAVYGMMLAMSAQQLAAARTRESQIVKAMHYQLIREILSGERNPADTTWNNGNASNVTLTCAALGNNRQITYTDRVQSAFGGGGAPYVLESTVSWTTPNGLATPTHTIRVYYVR